MSAIDYVVGSATRALSSAPHTLSNEQLLAALHNKSQEERKLTLEIIELLQETERRLLHLEKGYGSLLEFCVNELKYSEAAAYRHISAMWATKELPQVKKAIHEGTLNVSTVTQAQTFFRQERKYRDKVYTKAEKLAVFHQLENKSRRDVEKILIAKSPDLPKPEFVRKVTEADTRITMTIDQKLVDQLDEIKSKYSHINPNPSYAELIGLMAGEILRNRKEKQEKAAAKQRSVSPPAAKLRGKVEPKVRKNIEPKVREEIKPTVHAKPEARSHIIQTMKVDNRSRYIPASIRHFIHMRDGGTCTYIDPKTNKKCGSRFQLEIDHIKPFSIGGTSEPENLRLACRNHNQFYWEKFEMKKLGQ